MLMLKIRDDYDLFNLHMLPDSFAGQAQKKTA